MSIERVKKYLAGFGAEKRILELGESSATVELAAQAIGSAQRRKCSRQLRSRS